MNQLKNWSIAIILSIFILLIMFLVLNGLQALIIDTGRQIVH